jgi:mannose-6-phosphate isomerase-like protein (cupin superfamily)
MKHMPRSKAQKVQNSAACVVFEYDLGDRDVNGAVGVIDGRHPENGYVVNETCKEIVYVISGHGSLTMHEGLVELNAGDVALIPPGEPYFFKGVRLEIFMPCTPAWYPKQHKELKDSGVAAS